MAIILALIVTKTVSRDIHDPLVIVHTKLYKPATVIPVTLVVAFVGVVSVPPFKAVHNPVPGVAAFPVKLNAVPRHIL